jgi:hypothetical protein
MVTRFSLGCHPMLLFDVESREVTMALIVHGRLEERFDEKTRKSEIQCPGEVQEALGRSQLTILKLAARKR